MSDVHCATADGHVATWFGSVFMVGISRNRRLIHQRSARALCCLLTAASPSAGTACCTESWPAERRRFCSAFLLCGALGCYGPGTCCAWRVCMRVRMCTLKSGEVCGYLPLSRPSPTLVLHGEHAVSRPISVSPQDVPSPRAHLPLNICIDPSVGRKQGCPVT